MADASMEVDPPTEAPVSEEPKDEQIAKDIAPPAAGSEARTSAGAVAVRSIEGWIVMASNVHEEASEEDLQELFGDYGDIKNIHMNLDRRTGYVKGYVLVEFPTKQEALAAIDGTNGKKLLDQTLAVDFAFVRPEDKVHGKARGGERRKEEKRSGRGRSRSRSRSPGAE